MLLPLYKRYRSAFCFAFSSKDRRPLFFFLYLALFQAEFLADFIHYFGCYIGIILQKLFGVFPALSYPFSYVRISGTCFINNFVVGRQVKEVSFLRDTLSEDNIKLCLPEWRRNFVFYHLDPYPVSYHILPLLYRGDLAYIEAHG